MTIRSDTDRGEQWKIALDKADAQYRAEEASKAVGIAYQKVADCEQRVKDAEAALRRAQEQLFHAQHRHELAVDLRWARELARNAEKDDF